jgi:hypothetical protein
MNQITDYKVVTEQGTINLEREVKSAISQGWELLGGVSLMSAVGQSGTGIIMYAQALIKRKPS